MQKWEYANVELQLSALKLPSISILINGERVKVNTTGNTDYALQVNNLLNRMGGDGWEQTSTMIYLDYRNWVLKRPLP